MRPLTTLRWGMFLTASIGAPVFTLSACGDEPGCTTIGCASETPAPANTGTGGTGGASSGSGSFISDDGLTPGGGGTGALNEEDVCREVTFNAVASPVNVLILLDRSVSMTDPVDRDVPGSPTRWEAVTDALRAFVNSSQAAGASVGLQFFGITNGVDDCGADKYLTPAVEVAPLVGNRTALLNAIDGTQPGSFTPTQPAVEGALRYALQVAQRPENANIPTVVVLATDGMPSECGPVDDEGVMITSVSEIIDTLESYSQPPLDAAGNPTQPPIITYLVGTEELRVNANAFARAGGGQAFLVDGATGTGTDLEARFLDALLSIVVKPLDCELDVPQTAPDTGENIDFEQVRVRFTGATSQLTTEFLRARGPGDCGTNSAWYYDDNAAPEKIFFCRNACQSLAAGELKLELGCAPQMIVR